MAAGIYLSIPFCRQKCTYCNFASEARSTAVLPRYLEALEWEIRSCPQNYRQSSIPLRNRPVANSIYLGGGTPGLLVGTQLERLRVALADRFELSDDVEFTIEASPENCSAERATGWAAAGVNRVSMGVQSMVERELRAVGRLHTADTVADACSKLRKAGIGNLNLDLIAGLPHQTEAAWNESLRIALNLGVPHLSVYMLEVDEDSRLGGELLRSGTRFGAGDTPPEEHVVGFYHSAMDRLGKEGYEHYEISNFARRNFVSRHNEKYWTGAVYYGFGVDAHSFDGSSRWANADTIDDYLKCFAEERSPVIDVQQLSEQQRREEKVFLGLRRRVGLAVADVGEREMRRMKEYIQRGWLVEADGLIRLTDEGVIFSNEIFAAVLEK